MNVTLSCRKRHPSLNYLAVLKALAALYTGYELELTTSNSTHTPGRTSRNKHESHYCPQKLILGPLLMRVLRAN